MLNNRRLLPAMLAIGFLTTVVSAQTKPTTTSTDTPMAFMVGYDQLAGSEPEAYLPMYEMHGDAEARLGRGQARFDAEVGLLQRMVEAKWGHAGSITVLHAMGLLTGDDVAAAKVTVAGDHASVVCADGNRGPDLIKTATGWKVDMTALTKSLDMPVNAYLKKLRQLSRVIPDLADQLADGKFADADAMVGEINRQFNLIQP